MRLGSREGLAFEIWTTSVCEPDWRETGQALSGEGGACCPRTATAVSGRTTKRPAPQMILVLPVEQKSGIRQRYLTPVLSPEHCEKLRARPRNVVCAGGIGAAPPPGGSPSGASRHQASCVETSASSSRRSRPLVSWPKIVMRSNDATVGIAIAPAANPKAGTKVNAANPCAITPPILLHPATHPVARPLCLTGKLSAE